MSLPGVSISVSDGNLGRTVATEDGVVAMVLTGIAATSLALSVPAKFFSLQDAIAAGITLATHPHAYAQISDFYDQALEGAELYIMLVAETTTSAAVFTPVSGPMQKLLDFSQGRVTIAGTSMGRAVGYAPVTTGLLDYDLPAVAASAQALANGYAAKFTPVRIILDGTYLINPLPGVVPSVKGAGDRVGIFTGVDMEGKRAASMGRFLGRLALIPVEQSIGRVKTGQFSPNGALTSGLLLSSYSDAQLGSLHDAGYMVVRKFTGRAGVFIADDVMLATATSDFTSLARGRIIDKAIRLTYQTYVGELGETIDTDDDGNLSPTGISYLEDLILKTLTQQMVSQGNCTKVEVFINPGQNVIATDRLDIVLKIRVKGYLKKIVVNIGLSNPANT